MSIAKWARGLAGVASLGVIVASSQACVEAEGEFYVSGAAPAVDGGGDPCGDVSEQITLNVGQVVDLNGAVMFDQADTPVDALICVRNHLKSRTDNGVETSNIIFYQYDVSLDSGSATTHPISGSIDADTADGSTGLGLGTSFRVSLLTTSDTTAIAGGLSDGDGVETVATLKVYGRTTGGIDVETPDFYIPVRVYNKTVQCVCGADANAGEIECPTAQCN